MTPRRAASLALALLLAACGPPTPVKPGSIDPEFAAFQADTEPAADNCTVRERATVPIELDRLPLVPVQVNHRPAMLVLDTGAESAVLTASAARRLDVTTKYDFVRSMSGIGRAVRTGDARLQSFSIGGLPVAYPRALVGDVTLRLGGMDLDGLLGASLLVDFDLDIDVPHRLLTLYDRLDCDTARPPWARHAALVHTTRSLSRHPFFPIVVNGHSMMATLDTGAQRTVISTQAAAAAGIDASSQIAGSQTAQGATGETLPATLHAVDLTIAGEKLHVAVLVTAAGLPRGIDALVGLDFLLRNRVWLSYGSRRIFVLPE